MSKELTQAEETELSQLQLKESNGSISNSERERLQDLRHQYETQKGSNVSGTNKSQTSQTSQGQTRQGNNNTTSRTTNR